MGLAHWQNRGLRSGKWEMSDEGFEGERQTGGLTDGTVQRSYNDWRKRMTKDEAQQVARLLQQCHSGFAFLALALQSNNRDRTVQEVLDEVGPHESHGFLAFGFSALAFVYADHVFEDLERPNAISDPLDGEWLNVEVNLRRSGRDENGARLRHLRNCFAHGRYDIPPHPDGPGRIIFHDCEGANPSFEAECDTMALVDAAEHVLLAAHHAAVALALPDNGA